MIRRKPTRRQSALNDALHPPTNVRLVGVDGTEYPVQTVYTGMEDDCQVYEVVDPPAGVRLRMEYRVDTLPGKTILSVPFNLPEGE